MDDKTIIKWAFENVIFGARTTFSQEEGMPPEYHVDLTGLEDSLRIGTKEFGRLFDVGLGPNMSICRLKDEEMLKAKMTAENAALEKVEFKEFQRLQKKFGS